MVTWYMPSEEYEHLGGIQQVYRFENGYGASVVCHMGSYSSSIGKWELAVMYGSNDELCYTSGITEDVIGYLTENQVQVYLRQIANLRDPPP